MKAAIRITVALVYLALFAAVLPAQKSWTGKIENEKTRGLCKDGTAEYGTKNVCKKHGGLDKWIDKDFIALDKPRPAPKKNGNYQPLAVVDTPAIKEYQKAQIADEKAQRTAQKRAARELKKKQRKQMREQKRKHIKDGKPQ